jgi:hypothetical protein
MTTLPSLQQGFSCERSAADAKRRGNPAHPSLQYPSLRGGEADAAIQNNKPLDCFTSFAMTAP